MKMIFLNILLLMSCNLISAQSPLSVLEKAKEIKILESRRSDVKRILSKYKLETADDSKYYQTFSNKDAEIKVSYATGEGSDDSEDRDGWNVPEWTVTSLEISFTKPTELKDIRVDLLGFVKEKKYANFSQPYVYHNKDLGIGIETDEKEILKIYLVPRRNDYFSGCSREIAEEFYQSKSWFDSKLEERVLIVDYPADVTDLTLSQTVVIAACNLSASEENKSCPSDVEPIKISTGIQDPENDVLTYNYTVSGGKIIGQGAQVTWDLFGVPPGEYTITAGVDDGCGVCGRTVTKKVVVKQCPGCHVK